jgi:hypothetical protein
MLFDNFDKKVKEAAEQHHPAYDENAWRKMEHLLNEHLPQQKDRRRFFLLALTVLLIGGGAFFLLSRPHATKSDEVAEQTNSSTTGKTHTDKPDQNTAVIQPGINSNTGITNDNSVATATKITGQIGQNPIHDDQKILVSRQSNRRVDKNDLLLNNETGNDNKDIVVSQPEKKNDEGIKAPLTSQANEGVIKNNSLVSGPVTKGSEVANSTQQSQVAMKATPKNGRPVGRNGFSFFVSAGPDVSKAQNSKVGKVTLSWGLGVAYTLNRFTLKTGVFSANKIYWAGPDDYKLSYTPQSSVKFVGADANCRVIEIPVKLSYDFVVKNKSSWFAGAGLSSYLMKRENYLYEYKSNTTGNSYYHSYETKNENKHYFSVMNLSGGYTYRLNKTFSLSAEPYVEVPLTGIGAGKVHLNSGGVLFTVGVSPFRK